MPARPLSTFASEGWYRPSSGRSEHYFRPTGHGEHVLRSLCDHWSSSEEIRPHLTPAIIRSACAACREPWLAMLLAPQSEPWFPPEFDELASPHPPTREQIAEAIAKAEDADYWVDEVRQWEALEQWERDAQPQEYPGMAYEDRESFLRTADAVALIQNGAER